TSAFLFEWSRIQAIAAAAARQSAAGRCLALGSRSRMQKALAPIQIAAQAVDLEARIAPLDMPHHGKGGMPGLGVIGKPDPAIAIDAFGIFRRMAPLGPGLGDGVAAERPADIADDRAVAHGEDIMLAGDLAA